MDAAYFDAVLTGLTNIFVWPTFGYLLIGIGVGLVIGGLPAIGGVTGLILLLPFTYTLSGPEAFALLLGMYSTVAAGDSISSILIGVPGGVGSTATIIDGYPLAQKGQAARALGAAYASCAIGGLIGAVILAVSIPIAKPLVLAFGMPEYFAVGILGLVMVGTMAGKSVARGIAMAALGLVISAMGASDFSGVPRFWFGEPYLLQTPPMVSIVLGLFGIAEMLDMAVKNSSIARKNLVEVGGGGILAGVRDTIRNWWLVIRSSAIGVYIGVLPGLGASVVDWAAYGHAVQSAKDKSQFGKGDIRGVIAPEVANNSERGGALIPTLAFGIPGDFAMAILLGAFTIQGLAPGVDMLTTNLSVTYTMVWTIVIANFIGTILLMVWSKQIARIAFVDGHLIVPCVMLFILMGSWLGTTTFGDLIVMLIAGILGYWMKVSGWPRPPIVIALVLGNMIENSLIVSMRTYDGFSFLLRPVVLAVLALSALVVVMVVRNQIRTARKSAEERKDEFAGDMVIENPMLSLPLSVLLLGVLAFAAWEASQMRILNGIFPLVACAAGLASLVFVLGRDLIDVRGLLRGASFGVRFREAAASATLGRSLMFLSFVAAIVLGVYLIGQKLAIAIALGLYVVLWGRYAWWVGALFGAGVYATIHLLYDEILSINFHDPLLF
jgi:TctA family transporter